MKIILTFLISLSLSFSQVDTVVTVDASSYYDWVYFSFSQSQLVNIENPESSLDWDIAFQRKHIKTNSGLSGLGNGGAYVDSSTTWISDWELDLELDEEIVFLEDIVLNDFYNPITHMFGEGVKNPALNSWGWFDESYNLNVTHYKFLVRNSAGTEIVKFWPVNYYNQNGQGGNITFRYQTGFYSVSECNYIQGDVSYDSIVNVVDIIQIVNNIIGAISLDDCQNQLADLNNDSIVNVIDIIAIIDIIIER